MERFSDVDATSGRDLIAYLDFVTRVSVDDKRKTFAVQRLGEGMRVLDAGCGTGDDVRAISELAGATGDVTGIDSSNAMIEEARVRGVPANARFLLASATELPFDNGSFDAVRAERVLQHLADPELAVAEFYRVLAPGGTALVYDQDWESLSIGGPEYSISRKIARAFSSALAKSSAAREARGWFRAAGFTDVIAAPLVAMPPLPIAFELILQPGLNAALRAGEVDAEGGRRWLESLLEAERRGAFYCAVVVLMTLGRR